MGRWRIKGQENSGTGNLLLSTDQDIHRACEMLILTKFDSSELKQNVGLSQHMQMENNKNLVTEH